MFSEHDGLWVDADTLGGVVRLVDSDETVCDLKHVVPQRDDDELSVLGLLLHGEGDKKSHFHLFLDHFVSQSMRFRLLEVSMPVSAGCVCVFSQQV